MKVREIMVQDIPVLMRSDPLLKAVNLFFSSNQDVISVVDEDGDYIGVVKMRDLIWPFISFLEEDTMGKVGIVMDYPSIYLVDDIMEWDYPTVDADTEITKAIGFMEAEDIESIPVLDNGKPVGILTNSVILRLFFSSIEEL